MPVPRLLPLPGVGPEDVVVGPDGRLVAGVDDGAVLAVDAESGVVEEIARTGGRPLGLHANPDGSLLICDAERGLLRLDRPHGELEVLVDQIDGERLRFVSNVVEDSDGTLYFSSATSRYPLDRYLGAILEHSGTGCLFRRTPDGRVETLLTGLQFGNGVVLAPDRSHVLVAETGAYRVARYWLTGPQAGTSDYLLENLPGFPDNMGLGSDGLIWVTLAMPRDPMLDMLLPLPGVLRQIVWMIPQRLRPKPPRTAWVQAYTFTGELIHDLQREGDDIAMITGVAEKDGVVYLSSLTDPALAVISVPRSSTTG